MKYDPIKKNLGKFFNANPLRRKIFYKLLDLLLLRTWHIKKELKQWNKENNFAPKNILDAGSGFGQYVFYMSELNKNWIIKGVDVKDEQVEDCNKFFAEISCSQRVDFQTVDLCKLDLSEKYDLILSVDVMEHIEEDVKVFENFYKQMNTGAMLLINTPSDQGGSDVHDEDEHSFIDEHVRDGYNINEIQEKLESAGFSDITAYYNYGLPGKISWKISMKFPIIMLNASKLFMIFLPFYYFIVFPWAFCLNILDVNLKHKTGTGLIVKAYKR